MKRKVTIWTDYEIQRLEQLVSEGNRTNAQIAEILGRSMRSVASKRRLLALLTQPKRFRANAPKLVAEVFKFRMAGWSTAEIAKAFGTHQENVTKFIQRIGYSKRFFIKRPRVNLYRYWTEIELHRLRKYLIKGYSVERIHTYFPNRTLNAVFQKAKVITRHWGTPEEQAEREAFYKRSREKQLRVY